MTQRGRRIAFDYGDVRTGVALCDPDGILSSPLCVLESKEKNFLEKISSLLAEHEPIRIFVGLPVNMLGSKGESAEKVEGFVASLTSVTSLPIVLVDERLSTVSAQKKLKEAGVTSRDSKALIDAMAAVAILEQGLLSENLA
ncbi:COG0816 Predicted endonuclease involved in recombination (possible Holliday junction resolvase in Mycoplasmas and B. subtilis) [Candidatus Nanopelagicaceae bacterium]